MRVDQSVVNAMNKRNVINIIREKGPINKAEIARLVGLRHPTHMRRKTERANRLREIALASFEEKGYQSTTMSDIAAKLDVSVGTLYNHYRTKDALLLGIIREDSGNHTGTLSQIPFQGQTQSDALRSITEAYTDSFTRYGKRIWREFLATVLSDAPDRMQDILSIDRPFLLALD